MPGICAPMGCGHMACDTVYLTFRELYIMIYSYNKSQPDALFLIFI